MPISSADIKEVVLKEDDFGHEMRIGNIFSSVKYPAVQYHEFYVCPPDHGGTYKDHATGKARQFDFRCRVTKGRNREQNILIAAECKNLNPDLPLVVCGRPRTHGEDYHLFVKQDVAGNIQIKRVEGYSSIYKPDGFVGKSILRLKRKENRLCSDGDSEIYDRWSQALASSYDLVNDAARSKNFRGGSTFVMPIVVVPDNSLWTVSYKDDGDLDGEPQQVNSCEFYTDHKISIGFGFALTHIHFVTSRGLRDMLELFVSNHLHKSWDSIFNPSASLFNPDP